MTRHTRAICALLLLFVVCAYSNCSDAGRFTALPEERTLECDSPAPLQTVQCEAVPNSYIIGLREGVDVAEEAVRLASEYGFTLDHVFQIVPGFVALMSEEVANSLRCEPTVESIVPNCYIYPDGE